MPAQVLFGPEYLSLPRATTPWIVRSLVPRGGSTLVYAPAKQGKSTAILQLVEAMSAPPCMPMFAGLPIQEHGPVGYLQLDTPPDLWRAEYCDRFVEGGLDFSRVAFHDRDTMPKSIYPFNIRQSAHADWLGEWCAAFKPIAVVIDSYRASFLGEEKDSDVTTQVLQNLQKATLPAAMILIHHNRKIAADAQPRGDEGMVDESRGSSNLPAMVDVLWRLSRKRWKVMGRGGDATIDITFDRETGLLSPKSPVTADLIAILVNDTKLASDRQRASKLSELSGVPFETCRFHIKKWREQNPRK